MLTYFLSHKNAGLFVKLHEYSNNPIQNATHKFHRVIFSKFPSAQRSHEQKKKQNKVLLDSIHVTWVFDTKRKDHIDSRNFDTE